MELALPERFRGLFDTRQQKHIEFCTTYASSFAHGASGHIDMITIALLVETLVQSDADSAALTDRIEDMTNDQGRI